ncbi:hypothetical protein Tco_1061784 [Tanacetum coccineum]
MLVIKRFSKERKFLEREKRLEKFVQRVIFDLELVPTCLINIDLELHEIINLASSLKHLHDSLPSCDLCVIEKENNFKQPGDRYRSFSPDQDKNGSTTRIVGALSDQRGTHEIRKGVGI